MPRQLISNLICFKGGNGMQRFIAIIKALATTGWLITIILTVYAIARQLKRVIIKF
ncbi:hydrolase [Lactiplantibacillus paraplantarum]|uniref:Hydrolase n=2 Tax=Lactiplantibacillus paraplantarum TaxID=60520 RepID=A0A4V2L1K3_9LACO|nr:hydrolase [Lactiplantibacillus paraplantarum]AYJ39603.1 hydrolase [Lactiplantibacillus paraplantarum]TBX39514.1 hydrolase [Lactiplantibacillus paraplantarum]